MAFKLFTYGVLMYPELLTRLTGKTFVTSAATLQNHQRYALKKKDAPASPVIVHEPDASVNGLLVHDVDDNLSALLDDFEDVDLGLYVRELVPVLDAQGCEHEALTYVAGPEALDHLDGVWDPEKFLEQHYEDYLARIIPEFLKRW